MFGEPTSVYYTHLSFACSLTYPPARHTGTPVEAARIGGRLLIRSLALPAVAGIAAITLTISSSVFGPTAASAAAAPIQITGTEGAGVKIRPTPDTSQAPMGLIPESASPDYICFIYGEVINGVPIWFSVTYGGVTGYYSSAFDNSTYRSDEELTAKYGVPRCGSSATPVAAPAGPSVRSFDASGAVTWAREHAMDTQPFDAACTWFVSQAPWAGALEKTAAWTSEGSHSGWIQARPGTIAATEANTLRDYLINSYPGTTWQDVTAKLTTNAVPQAQPGDLMYYDWDGDGRIDHVAMITSLSSGQYPNVSEWGTVKGGQRARYLERGWTWSELHQSWLQESNPAMKVHLMRIGTVIGTY